MVTILVVEDDHELQELFCTVLEENGYHTLAAADGESALDILDHSYIDLIISDVMMPHLDGYTLTRSLREAGYQLPILMITAKSSPADMREGFAVGTDDYMVKPINVNEMLWRVAALLRRAQINHERKVTLGGTVFDCDTLTVSWGEQELLLPQKEFYLIYKLVSSPNRIFTRRQLMDEIWGLDSETDPHTLDVHINRLRDKFRDNQDFQIVTVRGLGYKAVRKDA